VCTRVSLNESNPQYKNNFIALFYLYPRFRCVFFFSGLSTTFFFAFLIYEVKFVQYTLKYVRPIYFRFSYDVTEWSSSFSSLLLLTVKKSSWAVLLFGTTI
jgi:hypothetical protein